MKRKNFKRKLISYVVIWSVFISSLLLYSPKSIVLSASGVPEINLITPNDGTVFDVTMVEFTGSVSDDSTSPDKLSVKVLEHLSSSDMPLDITSDGKLNVSNMDDHLEFSFSKDFSEGSHTISFVATDENGTSSEISKTFTVKQAISEEKKDITKKNVIDHAASLIAAVQETGTRPFVLDMKIVPKGVTDESGYLPAEDMTQVPLDAKIMIIIREAGQLTSNQPLIVSSKKGAIESIEDSLGTEPKKNKDGDYVVTFTPAKQLDPSTTYYVYVNPNIANDSGNKIIPRFFKFTTINTNHLDDIHGNYANNTNACAYCHSTHNGKNTFLEGGKYGAEANNLCMACHDGTNGSPMPDKYSTSKYTHAESTLKDSDSCTSCHNPHVDWSKENPNRFKSVTVTDANGSHYQTLSYNKASTAIGKAEDFSLCLSCHNGNKASNIDQYYNNATQINQSGHNITATVDSGSKLNGQIPCAECHETHGSNNIKMLREQIGNVKLKDADKFKTTGSTWSAADERSFCLTCHNGSTEIYGKTGTFDINNASGNPITGHQKDDTQACSSCHGGASKSAIEAAHAPKKLTP